MWDFLYPEYNVINMGKTVILRLNKKIVTLSDVEKLYDVLWNDYKNSSAKFKEIEARIYSDDIQYQDDNAKFQSFRDHLEMEYVKKINFRLNLSTGIIRKSIDITL